jgi:hypothetical protein
MLKRAQNAHTRAKCVWLNVKQTVEVQNKSVVLEVIAHRI